MAKRGKKAKGKASSKANGRAEGGAAKPTMRVAESLFRQYTLEEIRAAGSAVADAIGERESLQVEMKEVGELFKIRRESIDGRIGAAAKAIRAGGVESPVDCEHRFHVPRVGMKQVWRLDTNELVREEAMSVEECQEKLFATEEIAELEKMAGAGTASDSAPAVEGEKAEATSAEGTEGQAASLSYEGAEAQAQDEEGKAGSEEERLYAQAVAILVEANAVSATLLQRGLKIAYGRAARLIERMEERGVVSPLQAGKRQVILRNGPSADQGPAQDEPEASAGGQ